MLTPHSRQFGLTLDGADLTDAQAMVAITRITGSNFRLLHQLFVQFERILAVNDLCVIADGLVEAAHSISSSGAAQRRRDTATYRSKSHNRLAFRNVRKTVNVLEFGPVVLGTIPTRESRSPLRDRSPSLCRYSVKQQDFKGNKPPLFAENSASKQVLVSSI